VIAELPNNGQASEKGLTVKHFIVFMNKLSEESPEGVLTTKLRQAPLMVIFDLGAAL
jgi:hypothetical protein